MDIISQLTQNAVFSSLPAEKIIKIKKLAISRKFQKGEFVTHRGDILPYLLFINSGEFHAVKESGRGRIFVIESFQPGDMFWGLALLEDNKSNPMAIQTAIDGEILLWHKNQIKEIISADPQIAWGLFSMLAKKMERVGEILDELAFQPLTGRLANLLLGHYEDAVNNYVSRDLTLDEMAARIGSTREMVCKILYQFSDKGIIDIHRTEFKINDRDELVEIAKKMKG